MSVRETHVPLDRLAGLALAARAGVPNNDPDRQALAHVTRCEACGAEYGRLAGEFDALREAACHEADAVFDDSVLEAQRTRILDRLAHLGQAARVLHFPIRQRDATLPVSSVSRRWVSVAAAAGLIIGLVAGQLLHFVPIRPKATLAETTTVELPAPDGGSVIIQTTSSETPLTEDELLEAVESAVQLRRARSLQALDALTPSVLDVTFEIP